MTNLMRAEEGSPVAELLQAAAVAAPGSSFGRMPRRGRGEGPAYSGDSGRASGLGGMNVLLS